MTTVAKLKEAVNQALTKYNCCKTAVSTALQSPIINERNLTPKIAKFEEALVVVNEAHTSWFAKANLTPEQQAAETRNLEWLETVWVSHSELLQKAEDAILKLTADAAPPTHSNAQKLIIYTTQMESLQLDIQQQIANISDKIDDPNFSSQSHSTYLKMLDSLLTTLSSEYETLSQNILLLDAANINTIITAHTTFRQQQKNEVQKLQLTLAAKLPSTNQPSTTPGLKSIEMEKSKFPTFSGRTIDYPEFKRDWQKVAGVRLDDDNQVMQIKLKVDKDSRIIISRCHSMSEVWDALDNEYAQEQEVVNAVDSELMTLTSLKMTTSEYIVKLRNYLPTLEDALKSVNGLEHLQSPSRVQFLAAKFDERMLYEWEYFRSKNSGSTYSKFFDFLVDRYDAARSTIARLKSLSLASAEKVAEPENLGAFVNSTSIQQCRRCEKWTAQNGVYTCPACGRGTQMGEKVHHCLEHCGAYLKMSANDRSNCIEKAKWCPIHLVPGHDLSACSAKNDPRYVCGVSGCGKHHHKSLHESNTAFVVSINSTSLVSSPSVLLLVQSILTPTGSLVSFFDNGATCCLITYKAASRLQLTGEPVTLDVHTVTETSTIDSTAFNVKLLDSNNGEHIITAYALHNISSDIRKVEVSQTRAEFSPHIQNMWSNVENRPHGEIDLLIGMNECGLHPKDLETSGNLKVMSSIFGEGLVLGGTHSSIKSEGVEWSTNVNNIRTATVSVSAAVHLTGISIRPNREFFETEGMGVEPPRRCGNCQNCKECSFRSQQLSLREQFEYQQIESQMRYNEALQSFQVSYPFTSDPSVLPDNFRQVVKIAEREERKLMKKGHMNLFNTEFDKMRNHNALVELSPADLQAWKGPVHYVSLQPVETDSPTTPYRICTNSSLTSKNGLSLNSILMKGPNTLSDLWEIVTRWRNYEVALCSDVTKAYYSILTGETEKHVRRVVWRYGNLEEDWRVFAFRTVSFGDRPAQVILEIAIRKTAEMFWSMDPDAARRILNDRYVDDLASGGFQTEVSRFVGQELPNFQHNGTLSNILAQGSLKLKVIVKSGDTNVDKINKLGGSVLGLGWDPVLDTIKIKFNVNMDTIHEPLTTRKLLSIINGIFDILGLCSPFTVRLKAAFRDLFGIEPRLEWDDELPPEHTEVWLPLLHMMAATKEVAFPRATRSPNAIGQCTLICFFDGSDDAYGAVLYARWELTDGSVAVILVGSKPRVTPLKPISTPRSEANGAVLACRLVLSTVRSWAVSGDIPERVWFVGDSECTLASIEKVNSPFGEYFGNRMGEIHDNQAKIEQICPVGENGEWWHTESKNNGADIATRLETSCDDLLSDGWQHGPEYLKLPRNQWPLNRNFADRKNDLIPQNELLKRYRSIVNHVDVTAQNEGVSEEFGVHKLIDPYSTNSWETLLTKTQVLLTWRNKVKNDGAHVASQTLNQAKNLWYLTSMKETQEAIDAGKLRDLDIRDSNGLKVVVGRAKAGLQKFFGKDSLPVIMGSTRVAYLVMLWAHCQDHCGKDITMATARHEVWIVHANKLAKQITKSCIRCRFLRKCLEGQKMAMLPIELQGYCPPFSNVGVDLCGPYTVKSMTNKRATMKVWIVLVLCLNTKAISMELAPGYSTDDFLLAYTNHISNHGSPYIVHSDRGSQLVAAKKELCDDPIRYDWDAIAHATSQQGTTWRFTPSGAQWRNVAVEAFVKKFKSSFHHLYKETKLNYAQLLSAVKRISNILNDRPISVQKTKNGGHDEDFLMPLTPNMLITGRSGSGPPKDLIEVQNTQQSRSFIDELEQAWWYQYKVQYFHSLLPTRKWLEKKRNMMVGDVVLIEYSSKSAPGTYRLGRVKGVEVDEDNLVRTCTVSYKLIKPVTDKNKNSVGDVVPKDVRVPVQRLVLILPVEEQ